MLTIIIGRKARFKVPPELTLLTRPIGGSVTAGVTVTDGSLITLTTLTFTLG